LHKLLLGPGWLLFSVQKTYNTYTIYMYVSAASALRVILFRRHAWSPYYSQTNIFTFRTIRGAAITRCHEKKRITILSAQNAPKLVWLCRVWVCTWWLAVFFRTGSEEKRIKTPPVFAVYYNIIISNKCRAAHDVRVVCVRLT
jgi:hypothetical protein